MIISYGELAQTRQRDMVRRAEKRRLEMPTRREPEVTRIDDRRSDNANTNSARAA